MDEVPSQLKTAAIIQLVSGLLNMFVVGPAVWFLMGSFCGILTIFLGGIGGMCGMVGCLLVPVGMLEVIAGGLLLANPQSGAGVSKIVAFVEMATILCGGVVSAIAGFMALSYLNSDEVALYLEG